MHSIHENGTKVNGSQGDPGRELRQLTDEDWRIKWALEGFYIGIYEPECISARLQPEHHRKAIQEDVPYTNS